MNLRNARLDDLPILLEFEQGVIEEERPFNDSIRPADAKYYDLVALVNDPNTRLLLAETDGRVVGCGYVQLRQSKPAFVHENHAYLGFMYVEPDFRGQGVNKVIIDSLIAWCKDRDVEDFYLDVYVGNRAAIRAYEKAGFTAELVEMKLNSCEL